MAVTKLSQPGISEELAPNEVIAQKPTRQLRLVEALRREFLMLYRGLCSPFLAGLILLSLLLMTLAWQVPLDWKVKLGGEAADFLYVQGFNQAEDNPQFTFRWSSDESRLRFPGAGRFPQGTLSLTMTSGGRPANLGPAHVKVYLGDNGPLLGEVTVGPPMQIYRFNFNAPPGDYSGDLIFVLRQTDTFKTNDHALPLGVVVTQAEVTASAGNVRPVIPAPGYLAVLLATLVVFYLALVRSGWQPKGAAFCSLLLIVGASTALAWARLQLTPAVVVIFLTLLLSYPLLVLGLAVTKTWLARRGQDFPTAQVKWLGLIFVLAFVTKGAGINHPAFLTLDHWFRIHQILRFVNQPNVFWNEYFHIQTGWGTSDSTDPGVLGLGQWGISIQIPYSPLFYLFAAPLAYIWPTHDPNLLAGVNLLGTWLEVSQVWLLYIIARRAYRVADAGWAGVIAAAVFGFYPLSYLLFSDGGYNSIFAEWLSVFFIAILVDCLQQRTPKVSTASDTAFLASEPITKTHTSWTRWQWAILIITLAGALLAHTFTMLMVGTLVVFIVALMLIVRDSRRIGWRVGLVVVAAFAIALIAYYGYYLIGFLTQSLPTLLHTLQTQGNVGQNGQNLGRKLLGGFWPQLWAHFRLFPFLLTIVALIGLWPFGKLKSIWLNDVERQRSRTLYLVWLAWLLAFLLFALVDLKVNLLQKHMMFVAPLLCLGSGWGFLIVRSWLLSLLSKRSSISSKVIVNINYAVSLIMVGLVIFLAWQGLTVWYDRVFNYILPPGSG